MKIYNEEKTEILENPDLNLGYLKQDCLVKIIPEQKEIKKVSHYEPIKIYYTDKTSSTPEELDETKEIFGKQMKEVIDVEGQPYIAEHEEKEEIQVYIPYTEAEILDNKKNNLRLWREKYFTIIDRAVWFDCLSEADKNLVRIFRTKLLNITETLEYPEVPECVTKEVKAV